MNRIALSLLVVAALAVAAEGAVDIEGLRAKIAAAFPQSRTYSGSSASVGGYNGANGGFGTGASAAVGDQYGGASAAAMSAGYAGYQPVYAAQEPQAQFVAPAPPAPYASYAPVKPVQQVPRGYYGNAATATAYGGRGARAGAAAAVRTAPAPAPVQAPAPAPVQVPTQAPAPVQAPIQEPAPPAAPSRPAMSIDQFTGGNRARFAPRRRVGGFRGGAAAAAAGSGVASAAGVAGSVGSDGGASGVSESYSGVASSAAGTLANNGVQHEASAYKRNTESVENHEDGKVDDNHYYNAQSYGKAEDENMHEAYSKDDEDLEATPTVYRSKKSGEKYVMDYNKNRRESGSGVLAKDKHSSAFNKNSKRFNENVDQTHLSENNGIVENSNQVSSHSFDDDDEELFDSDGFAQVQPATLAASSAVGGQRGGSVATSAAYARGN